MEVQFYLMCACFALLCIAATVDAIIEYCNRQKLNKDLLWWRQKCIDLEHEAKGHRERIGNLRADALEDEKTIADLKKRVERFDQIQKSETEAVAKLNVTVEANRNALEHLKLVAKPTKEVKRAMELLREAEDAFMNKEETK